jgi:sulfur-carrier protein
MAIPVRIPTPLRKLTQNQEVVEADGTTIRELIDSLDRTYPGLKERICDDQDHIRRFVNVFLNDEDVRFLKESETPVGSGDEVSIVPAIAGG